MLQEDVVVLYHQSGFEITLLKNAVYKLLNMNVLRDVDAYVDISNIYTVSGMKSASPIPYSVK